MNAESTSVAVVGLGYWGPNRLRALNEIMETKVSWICDSDIERLERHARRHPEILASANIADPLADPSVDAVVLATPAFTHHDLATRCLLAGKHVFVEKPLAASTAEAADLVELAEQRGLVLVCGHTFLHSPAVRAVKRILDRGDLGELYFISSSRVNLGPYRSDVGVIFDLGPHDFSILRYWLDSAPSSVSAVGRAVITDQVSDVAFIDLTFPDGLLAHVELSWLAPSKMRQTVIVGSEKMLVYQDGSAEPVRALRQRHRLPRPRDLRRVPALLPHRRRHLGAGRRQGADRLRARGLRLRGADRLRPGQRPRRCDGRTSNGRSCGALPLEVRAQHAAGRRARRRRREERAMSADTDAALESSLQDPVAATNGRPGIAPAGSGVISTQWGRRDRISRRMLLAADLIGIATALYVASLLAGERSDPLQLVLFALPTLPVWALLFKLYGLYDRDVRRISHAGIDDLPWLFHAVVVGTLLFWAYLHVEFSHDARLLFAEAAWFGAISLPLLVGLRSLARTIVLGRMGAERILIAGAGPTAALLVRKITQHPEYGLTPIGRLAPNGAMAEEIVDPGASEPPKEPHVPLLGTSDDLERLVSKGALERVILCRADLGTPEVLKMADVCHRHSVKVGIVPGSSDAYGPSVELDAVEGVTILGVNPPVLGRTSRWLKRGFDLVIASAILLVAAPLMALIAIAIRIDSRGPVFYRQARVGRAGKHFMLNKFRTMVPGAERQRAALMKHSQDPNWLHLDDDPRITRLGALLRRTSLDELPQLWNVIRGRNEPRRPATPARARGRQGRRLDPWPPRPHPRHHRPLAGPRPHEHPLRGDGQARLHLRDQLVGVDGHAPADAHPSRRPTPSRRELAQAGGISANNAAGGYVVGHNGAGTHPRLGADRHTAEDDRPGADRRAVLDRDLQQLPVFGTLERAVSVRGPGVLVVDEHDPVADEHAVADPDARADEGMTLDLAARSDLDTLLDLDEGSDA